MRYDNLGQLREKLIGFSRPSAARLSGVAEDRLAALESGSPPTILEADRLGRLYGLEPELLEELPVVIPTVEAVRALALLDESRDLAATTRVTILDVAAAARDLGRLRSRLGLPATWETFRSDVQPLGAPRRAPRPYEQGRHYANEVRRRFGPRRGPIASARDFVREHFPSMTLLYAELGPDLAGLTFADPLRGPVIVLNLDGKNRNPAVRRFSLMHELCHLLVDSDRHEPLATISGFLSEGALEREQRANAFAARLLCPEGTAKQRLTALGPARTAGELVSEFGLHYGAARLYLKNLGASGLPVSPPPEVTASSTSALWTQAEAPDGLEGFPVLEVPSWRRTHVAQTAAELYARGELGRDRFAALLGVTPAADLEAVLAWFNLDPPENRRPGSWPRTPSSASIACISSPAPRAPACSWTSLPPSHDMNSTHCKTS